MKHAKKIALISLLLTSLTADVVSPSFKKPRIEYRNSLTPYENINIGELAYSTEMLHSDGYSGCSALILDHGPGAVMAHAHPGYEADSAYNPKIGAYDPRQLINAHDVVERSLFELKVRKIGTKNLKAIVHAGNPEDLDRIVKNLQKNGIKIKYAKLKKDFPDSIGCSRDIYYNPKTNHLKVKYKPTYYKGLG